jgi:methylated-DNA-protein-cysteine methyltransferase-like protein
MGFRTMNTAEKAKFNSEVWIVVKQIPSGKVATYGQIASMVKKPENVEDNSFRAFGPRWVGAAMATCPEDVPWHRVVNSQGRISIRGEGTTVQRERLESEGVKFDDQGRINLKVFQWQAPTPGSIQPELPL